MTRERIFRSTIVEAVLAGRQPPGKTQWVGPGPYPLAMFPDRSAKERRQVGQRAACENDAMRLCSEFGGDVQRITTFVRSRYLIEPPRLQRPCHSVR